MTELQFLALATLLNLRAGPARDAARLVLVDGLGPTDAAAEVGLPPAVVDRAVARARRGFGLARMASGLPVEGAVRVP